MGLMMRLSRSLTVFNSFLAHLCSNMLMPIPSGCPLLKRCTAITKGLPSLELGMNADAKDAKGCLSQVGAQPAAPPRASPSRGPVADKSGKPYFATKWICMSSHHGHGWIDASKKGQLHVATREVLLP